MLIHPLDLQQFGQRVNEKPTKLHFRRLEGFYETTKGTQNDPHKTIPK
jgi:hypothetical protein